MATSNPQRRQPLAPGAGERSLEVEQALLGGLLVQGEALYGVSLILNAECFTYPAHRRIYTAMLALQGRGAAIDLVSVGAELRGSPELAEVGGVGYLADLSLKVASAAHAPTHAKILRELWTRRQLVAIGDGLTQGVGAAEDVFDVIDGAQEELSSLITTLPTERPTRIDTLMNDTLLLVDRLRKERAEGRRTLGVATGLPHLDGLLCGMMGGELHVLAARPAVGKTALALWIAAAVARSAKTRTLFFSLEMSKAQLGLRLLSLVGGVSHAKLIRGALSEEEHQQAGRKALATSMMPVYVDDSPAIRLNELCAKARAQAAGGGVDFIVVDYLQLVTVPNARSSVPREQIVGQISRALKALAKELKVPVLALAQLNRAVETRAERRPALADLRESGSIEQDADAVMVLHAPSRYGMRQYPDGSSTEGIVELLLLKNRKGECGTVYLEFDGDQMRFAESRCQDDRYRPARFAAEAFGAQALGAKPCKKSEARRGNARYEAMLSAPSALPTYLDVMKAKAEAEAKGEDEGLPF